MSEPIALVSVVVTAAVAVLGWLLKRTVTDVEARLAALEAQDRKDRVDLSVLVERLSHVAGLLDRLEKKLEKLEERNT